MSAQISVDTGGTHTDLVLLDAGQSIFRTLKVPTTPEDLSIGILDGIEKILNEAQLSHADVERFIYGTTLVTNIIVEQKDVDVGLITTHGFRDVLAIGRASRKPNIYDIHWRPNPALVARRHRMTVTERINAKGEVVEPLDEASAVRALGALAAAGITSVAAACCTPTPIRSTSRRSRGSRVSDFRSYASRSRPISSASSASSNAPARPRSTPT